MPRVTVLTRAGSCLGTAVPIDGSSVFAGGDHANRSGDRRSTPRGDPRDLGRGVRQGCICVRPDLTGPYELDAGVSFLACPGQRSGDWSVYRQATRTRRTPFLIAPS